MKIIFLAITILAVASAASVDSSEEQLPIRRRGTRSGDTINADFTGDTHLSDIFEAFGAIIRSRLSGTGSSQEESSREVIAGLTKLQKEIQGSGNFHGKLSHSSNSDSSQDSS